MKAIFRILGTAAAVVATGAAIVIMDKAPERKGRTHHRNPSSSPRKPKRTTQSAKTPGGIRRG